MMKKIDALGLIDESPETTESSTTPEISTTDPNTTTKSQKNTSNPITAITTSKPIAETTTNPGNGQYLTYEEIKSFLKSLEQSNPRVNVLSENVTREGREIFLVVVKPYIKVNVRNEHHNQDRKSVWIEGGLEGYADDTAMILTMIESLSRNCPKEYENNDYYFAPLVNPDGYEYVRRTGEAGFKKNREETPGSPRCKGVRLNRNFPPTAIFASHSSSNPCDDDYRGAFAGSTREVAAIMKLKSALPHMVLALTLLVDDISSNELNYPFAHTRRKIIYDSLYREVGSRLNIGLATPETLYSGSSMDFWYLEQPSCFSFTLRLRLKTPTHIDIKDRARYFLPKILSMTDAINSITEL